MGPTPMRLHPATPWGRGRGLLLGIVLAEGLKAALGSSCPSNSFAGDSGELGGRSVCREMGWDEPSRHALPRAAAI